MPDMPAIDRGALLSAGLAYMQSGAITGSGQVRSVIVAYLHAIAYAAKYGEYPTLADTLAAVDHDQSRRCEEAQIEHLTEALETEPRCEAHWPDGPCGDRARVMVFLHDCRRRWWRFRLSAAACDGPMPENYLCAECVARVSHEILRHPFTCCGCVRRFRHFLAFWPEMVGL